jgi:enoyl-CoA hydratase/carnithine racemase
MGHLIMTADETGRLLIFEHGAVLEVRLNRPEKLNAIDDVMLTELIAIGEELSRSGKVRAVVLAGEGKGFCSGLDVAALSKMDDRRKANSETSKRPAGRITNRSQHAAWLWSELPMPVIAALHGVVFGGGLQIALGADVRLVSPDAKLSALEIRWGLVPDITGTFTLPRLVGVDVAKEMTWTGRAVSGEEAVRLGLATMLADDPRIEALALAQSIASQNPDAVRAAKRLLNASMSRTPEEQFLDEESTIASLVGTNNQLESVAAYLGKRTPNYTDPANS